MKTETNKSTWMKRLLVISAICLAILAGINGSKVIAADTDGGTTTGDTGAGDDGSGTGDTGDVGDTGDTGDTGDEAVAPSFSNPAQAQHAANLALEVASQPDAELESLQAAVTEAEQNLDNAIENGAGEDEVQALSEALSEAQDAYAAELSERTGVVTGEISAMRESGMGWGQIAHELGVHPGLLGLGHTKRERNKEKKSFASPGSDETSTTAEVSEATERNPRSGWSNGHGVGMKAGVDSTSKTTGYAFGKNKSKGGVSGAAGLSGSGGNSGNGKGGGSGKGVAGSDGSPGNSGNKGGGKGNANGNKGGKSGGNGKGGGKGKK